MKIRIDLTIPQIELLRSTAIGKLLPLGAEGATELALWRKLFEACKDAQAKLWTCKTCGKPGTGRAVAEPGGGRSHERCVRTLTEGKRRPW